MVNKNKVRMKVKVKFNMRVGQKSKTRIFGRQGEISGSLTRTEFTRSRSIIRARINIMGRGQECCKD